MGVFFHSTGLYSDLHSGSRHSFTVCSSWSRLHVDSVFTCFQISWSWIPSLCSITNCSVTVPSLGVIWQIMFWDNLWAELVEQIMQLVLRWNLWQNYTIEIAEDLKCPLQAATWNGMKRGTEMQTSFCSHGCICKFSSYWGKGFIDQCAKQTETTQQPFYKTDGSKFCIKWH